MRTRTPSGLETAAWILGGLGIGLVAGLFAAGWVGTVSRARLRRAMDELGEPAGPPLTTAGAARAVESALESSDLWEHHLSVVAVTPHQVELHGWVPDRALRARAARLVREVPGIESVVNRLLVRGEDDRPGDDRLRLSDQPA